jgi:hypothetical protein
MSSKKSFSCSGCHLRLDLATVILIWKAKPTQNDELMNAQNKQYHLKKLLLGDMGVERGAWVSASNVGLGSGCDVRDPEYPTVANLQCHRAPTCELSRKTKTSMLRGSRSYICVS